MLSPSFLSLQSTHFSSLFLDCLQPSPRTNIAESRFTSIAKSKTPFVKEIKLVQKTATTYSPILQGKARSHTKKMCRNTQSSYRPFHAKMPCLSLARPQRIDSCNLKVTQACRYPNNSHRISNMHCRKTSSP